MNIDIVISAEDIKEEKIRGKVVVIIDMLRATSVIVTALKNGCKEVIPVLTVEEARQIVQKDKAQYKLGGERKAIKIEGFDYSNSPLEYTKENIEGKTLVMTTTNGTKTIKRSEVADAIYIGAMINAKAVAEKLMALGKDIVIVNAGTYGQFSMDDFICSGYIIDWIMKGTEVTLSDIAFTSHYTYSSNQDIISFLKHASHYKYMTQLGLQEDLAYCCRKDIIDLVPIYKEGKIQVEA